MRTLPKDGGASSSLWIDADVPSFDAPIDAEVDVCVIGAGISGLTTAFELARRGVRVTVLDDGPLGGGETHRTSAHLASAVDDHYYELETKFGAEGARLVADSHKTAIDYIEAVSRELGIDCDFRRVDGYLIVPPGDDGRRHRHELEREHAAAQRAGLTCEMVEQAPLGFDTGRALRFANQAQFHPMKYVRGLAQAAVDAGARIHSGVHVEDVEAGEPLVVKLAGDRVVRARHVVDATNAAFTSPIHMPLRQAAFRTYVVAFAIPTGNVAPALYWDTADPYHYIRVAPADGHDVLIVGGNDHRTGQGEPEAQFALLESWTRTWFPMASHIVARWSGQILEPADCLAHIGPNPSMDHVFVITGDSGNGLTHGTIGGLMIPEMIQGRRPRWAHIYDPGRSHVHAAGKLVKEAARSTLPYLDWMRGGDVDAIEDIPVGEGAVVRRGLHLIAAYRDQHGDCQLRSATCPHLKASVRWNPVEKTWDCPAHGSRFDRYGRCLNGPAPSDLTSIQEPQQPHAPPSTPPDAPREHALVADDDITQRVPRVGPRPR